MAFYFYILTTMHGQNHIKFIVLNSQLLSVGNMLMYRSSAYIDNDNGDDDDDVDDHSNNTEKQ